MYIVQLSNFFSLFIRNYEIYHPSENNSLSKPQKCDPQKLSIHTEDCIIQENMKMWQNVTCLISSIPERMNLRMIK